MDPARFLADLEAKPARLRELARLADDGALHWPDDLVAGASRVLLAGMGSSWFAAQVAALRMRRLGLAAMAELASVEASWPPRGDLLVVGISASGASVETLEFVQGHGGVSRVVALTNVEGSTVTEHAAGVVLMHAGPEEGGVACRSYQHTLVALLALEEQLGGVDLGLAAAVRATADACEHLLGTRDRWLPGVLDALDGGAGVWALAPAERIGSALQGALMVREGPRRLADGCETGDWSHVDVYLTKTLDYRALVFPGSRYDAAAADWMTQRGSTAVAVGGEFPAATLTVRYPGDDDPLVSLLAEVLVPELVAATWWHP